MSSPSSRRSSRFLRPYAMVYLYRSRLRVNLAQELMAAVGVAIAVALLFSTLVASSSISSSSEEVVRAVIGPADLQVRSRSSDGFDEGLLRTIKLLPGVEQAAPLLEQTATISGPRGRSVTVDIAGTDPTLAILNGLAHSLPISALTSGTIGLSRTTANQLGLPADPSQATSVDVRLRGSRFRLKVSAVLGPEAFGALSGARVAVMPTAQLQELAGLPRRISRILVESRRGSEAKVRAALLRLTGARLVVASADQDEQLLKQTLAPSNQASALFAAISALLGFLFAFNAMLLTVPERRQVIAGLRIEGTRRSAIAQMVVFQALCLGIGASLVGVLAGYGLSRGVFHQSPGYLGQAFTLGTGTVVASAPLALAFAGGTLATLLASLLPLFDLRPGRAFNAVYEESGSGGNLLTRNVQRGLLALAVGLLACATLLFSLAPSTTIVACVLLALATISAVPVVFAGVLAAAKAVASRREGMTLLPLALVSLRSTTLRSLALAATGALALFGSIALGGARNDLLRGIAHYTSNYVASADVWLVNPHDNQAVNDFAAGNYASEVARTPGVRRVQSFQGSFLDVGDRRVWVIAWPAGTRASLLEDQIVAGSLDEAAARIRTSGWITVSQEIAARRHVGVGDSLSIPTPSGNRSFRIAATTTNFGWSPGAIVLDGADYSSLWHTTAPSALGVEVAPGASIPDVRRTIERSLGPSSGLEALTARERAASINGSANEGLAQLGDIATLLMLAAVLAMLAALGSSIWQRRVSLAALRLEGAAPSRLRRLLLVEVLLMLSAGCVTGALAGIYGEFVIDEYLRHVTGFPVASGIVGRRPLEIFLIVVLSVLLVAVLPGWAASRVSPGLALEE
ncbi:MAG TPA: ABC transporter permease [Solirubrobacteraceae bacterium]|nr:ABC transporter permease [Solirubrobacteraceae bacterium]